MTRSRPIVFTLPTFPPEIVRVYHRLVWSYNECDGGTRDHPVQLDKAEEYAHLSVGDDVTHYYGAPGCGQVTYRVTEISETGVFGYVVSDTGRELTLEDVR